jgi:hypothetical protein
MTVHIQVKKKPFVLRLYNAFHYNLLFEIMKIWKREDPLAAMKTTHLYKNAFSACKHKLIFNEIIVRRV